MDLYFTWCHASMIAWVSGSKTPIAFLRAFETGGPESETLTTSRLHPTTKEPLKILLITILPRFSNPI